MSNLLLEPSFEDVTPWTLGDHAVQNAGSAKTGSFGVVLPARTAPPGPWSPYVQQDVTVTVGDTHTLSIYGRHGGGTGTLELGVFENGTYAQLATLDADVADGTWELLAVAHQPTATPSTFFVRATGAALWDIDDAAYLPPTTGVDMAVTLAERSVREILCTLQANLGVELSKIVSSRGDALALPGPDKWFDYQHDEFSAETVQLEVFETGVSFPETQTDFMLQGQHCTAQVAIVIRLSHANRTQLTPSQMAARSRRYQVAIRNVLADNPGLYTPQPSQWADPQAAATHVGSEFDATRQRIRDRVTFELVLNQCENRDGETTPGGAALPALPIAVS